MADNFELPLIISRIMNGFGKPWFVAGGWAIDLFLNKVTRKHNDIEIAIFRDDQLSLRKHLKKWIFKKVNKKSKDQVGELLIWEEEEILIQPIHEVHAFSSQSSVNLDELEILLNEREGDHWIYRRNPSIVRELSQFGLKTSESIPYLAPEIVLLYKSKNPKSHDEADFQTVLGQLEDQRVIWLKKAIEICHPDHPWLTILTPNQPSST